MTTAAVVFAIAAVLVGVTAVVPASAVETIAELRRNAGTISAASLATPAIDRAALSGAERAALAHTTNVVAAARHSTAERIEHDSRTCSQHSLLVARTAGDDFVFGDCRIRIERVAKRNLASCAGER